jgi:hypothetical protein
MSRFTDFFFVFWFHSLIRKPACTFKKRKIFGVTDGKKLNQNLEFFCTYLQKILNNFVEIVDYIPRWEVFHSYRELR